MAINPLGNAFAHFLLRCARTDDGMCDIFGRRCMTSVPAGCYLFFVFLKNRRTCVFSTALCCRTFLPLAHFLSCRLPRRGQVWAEKEMRNLKRLVAAGIPSPAPVLIKNNVLVMDFLGKAGWPAPRLRDVHLGPKKIKVIAFVA